MKHEAHQVEEEEARDIGRLEKGEKKSVYVSKMWSSERTMFINCELEVVVKPS